MLLMLQIFQVIMRFARSTVLIGVNGFGERGRAQRIPRRITLRTQRQHHEHGQHQKQCLRYPERKKNLEEETFHDVVFTFSRGRAKM